MGNGKAMIAAEMKTTIDEHGRRIKAHGFLCRGDGAGTLVADQGNRLAFYWIQSPDGVRAVAQAVLHPQSTIVFENNIEYENIPVDIGKVEHDDTLYILGQNSFGVSSGGGTTIIERKIAEAAQAIALPLSVIADPAQPSLAVYMTAYTFDIGGTIYQFPNTAKDLTANIPGSADQMCYAVLFLQNDYVTIEVQTSTPRSTSGLPLGAADIQEARTAATSTSLAVFAVKLVNGQTAIAQGDLNRDGVPLQQNLNTLATPTIVASVHLTAQTSAIADTDLFTPPTDGQYQVQTVLTDTTTGISGTITATITWTDYNGAQTVTTSAITVSGTGEVDLVKAIYAKSSAAIKYRVDFNTVVGSPAFAIDVKLIRMS